MYLNVAYILTTKIVVHLEQAFALQKYKVVVTKLSKKMTKLKRAYEHRVQIYAR